MTDWLTQLKNAKKSCLIDRNLKKIHYQLDNGKQLVEEYNLDTGVLNRRAWKCVDQFANEDKWDIEIGDPEPTINDKGDDIIRESSGQPMVSRRNTKINLEWRIRNLPYPVEIYNVTADTDEQCLVVRTTNKKYFKKLPIPDLARLNIMLEQANVSFSHKFNTLIIVYKKPKELLDFDKALYNEIKNIEPQRPDGPDNCRPS